MYKSKNSTINKTNISNPISIRSLLSIFTILLIFSLLPITALATDEITITRDFVDEALPSSELTVTLTVDVDEENIPKTYILTEEVPQGFEIISTSARTVDGNIMKWIFIDGVFGKIEDKELVYIISTPTEEKSYSFNGTFMLIDESVNLIEGKKTISITSNADPLILTNNNNNDRLTNQSSTQDSNSNLIKILSYLVVLIIIITIILISKSKITSNQNQKNKKESMINKDKKEDKTKQSEKKK